MNDPQISAYRERDFSSQLQCAKQAINFMENSRHSKTEGYGFDDYVILFNENTKVSHFNTLSSWMSASEMSHSNSKDPQFNRIIRGESPCFDRRMRIHTRSTSNCIGSQNMDTN